MLPEGWRQTKLGDLYSFKNGLNAEKSAYGAGTKFVNVMDVFGNDVLTADRVVGSITVSKKQLANMTVERGDVLFNRTSETAEEIALSAVYLDDEPITFGGFVIRGRPVSNAVFPKFSMYALQSSSVRREMIRRAQGGIRANIGQGDIAAVSIALPPRQEQIRIADLLKTWDEAIETVDKLIETARAQKKALMQQLLTGKRRLPGFEGAWERVSLGEVANILVSNVDKKNVTGERAVQLCNYMDVYRATEIVAGTHYMVATATSAQIGKFGLRGGDVLITKDSETPADIAVSAFVPEDNPGLVCGYHLAIIRPQQAGIGRFLKYVFDLPDVRNYFASRANGATRFGLTIDAITSAPIQLPSQDECRAVAEVIKFADADVASLTGQRNHLEIEKRALMQQLLTGKRRVKLEEMA